MYRQVLDAVSHQQPLPLPLLPLVVVVVVVVLLLLLLLVSPLSLLYHSFITPSLLQHSSSTPPALCVLRPKTHVTRGQFDQRQVNRSLIDRSFGCGAAA